jgi:hypothetical protein
VKPSGLHEQQHPRSCAAAKNGCNSGSGQLAVEATWVGILDSAHAEAIDTARASSAIASSDTPARWDDTPMPRRRSGRRDRLGDRIVDQARGFASGSAGAT